MRWDEEAWLPGTSCGFSNIFDVLSWLISTIDESNKELTNICTKVTPVSSRCGIGTPICVEEINHVGNVCVHVTKVIQNVPKDSYKSELLVIWGSLDGISQCIEAVEYWAWEVGNEFLDLNQAIIDSSSIELILYYSRLGDNLSNVASTVCDHTFSGKGIHTSIDYT